MSVDGRVFSCCASRTMLGDLNVDAAATIWKESMTRFREETETGMPAQCKGCHIIALDLGRDHS